MGTTPAGDQLSEALARLARARRGLQKAQRAAAAYPPDDPEPYGATAARLGEELAAAWDAVAVGERQRKQLAPPDPPPAPAAGRLFQLGSRLARPAEQWRVRRQARSFLDSIQALEAQVEQVGHLLDDLDRKPLAAAARCQRVSTVARRLEQVAEDLRAAGLRGATFKDTLARSDQLLLDLGRLPGCFFRDAEEAILAQAGKAETIQAWQALDQVEGPLGRQVGQLEDWVRAVRAIAAELANLEPAVAAARSNLARAPQPLDLDEMSARVEHLDADAGRLRGEAASPQVEDLYSLLAAIRRTGSQAQDLARQAASLPEQLDYLAGLFTLADDLLAGVQRRMTELSTLPDYAIDWEGYWTEAKDCLHARAIIPGPDALRTPGRLAEDRETLEGLCLRLRALSEQVDLVRGHRDQLLLLARRPELAARPAWLARAARLHAIAVAYDPLNWTPELAVPWLHDNAAELDGRRQAILPGASRRLPATHLAGLLRQADDLRGQVEQLQDRLDRTAGEIATLQRIEQAAFQGLESALPGLASLVPALSGVRPRLPSKIAAYRGKVERLDLVGKALLVRLGQRHKGTVAKKYDELIRWQGSSQAALHALSLLLVQDHDRARGALQAELDTLRQVADLDLEPAMIDATHLLQRQPPGSELAAGDSRSLSIAALAAAADRLLAARSQPLKARDRLETEIAKPLDRAREAWEQARDGAAAEYAALVSLKQQVESTWPPLACDVERARSLVAQAQAQERHLAQGGRSVSNVRETWARAVDYYQQALDEIRRTRRDVGEHRHELAELAERLDRWQRQLAAYQLAHANDQAIGQAIRARLARIDSARDSLSRQWAQDPPSFREARNALKTLLVGVYDDIPVSGTAQPIRIRDIESTSR